MIDYNDTEVTEMKDAWLSGVWAFRPELSHDRCMGIPAGLAATAAMETHGPQVSVRAGLSCHMTSAFTNIMKPNSISKALASTRFANIACAGPIDIRSSFQASPVE